MNILKYRKFNESQSEKYSDITEEIKSLINDSLEISESKDYEDFKLKFNKDPESVKIEGLINDSDIYDFYLKWRTDIDSILSDCKYFDEVPSQMGIFSLYESVVKGTTRAVSEILKD